MAIGLVLALAISLSMLAMGRQFRVVGANSAAQVNAQLALSLIDESGRAAGAGLFNNGQPICQRFNAWHSGSVKSNGAALMPARITDGGSAGSSDTIVFSSSNAIGPLSALPVLDTMAGSTAGIVVPDAGVVAANDVAIVGVPGSTSVPCTLLRVSATPAVGAVCGGNAAQCQTLQHAPDGTYNPPAGTFGTEPAYSYTTAGGSGPAVVMRLGTEFRQNGFQVACNTLITYNAFTDNPSCTAAPVAFAGGANALVSDVVLMHAQYGISASASSDIVTNWVDAKTVGGVNWASPGAADIGRIKAIRVVLVTRSKEPASDLVTAASCTNGGGVVNTGPCSFDDAEAPALDLSGVAVPSGRSWRNFRYRVHQAVIPLRNAIWSS